LFSALHASFLLRVIRFSSRNPSQLANTKAPTTKGTKVHEGILFPFSGNHTFGVLYNRCPTCG
jgi:hypothetical protein